MKKKKNKSSLPLPATKEKLAGEEKVILGEKFFVKILNAFPEMVLVLDKSGQAVYCNDRFLKFSAFTKRKDILGKRPGQALKCVNACDDVFEYGRTESCQLCGIMKLLVADPKIKQVCEECKLTTHKKRTPESFDFRVWKTEIKVEKNVFFVFVLQNIVDVKRREILQRIFFHDVNNDISALSLRLNGLKPDQAVDEVKIKGMKRSAKRLVDTIAEQNDLLAAEEGRLKVSTSEVSVNSFLKELREEFLSSKLSEGRKLVLEISSADKEIAIKTDRMLLWRIMGNLIKNALEAAKKGGAVKLGFRRINGKNQFFVQNPNFIAKNVQLQIFKRFYTTKGKGRGIGTYSVKILTEQYLKGKAYLESTKSKGTTFFIDL